MAISKITLNGVTQMDVTQKTVTANTMLNGVTSLQNDGTDITGNIQSKTSSDLTVNGATVTAPAGHYQSAASKTIPNADACGVIDSDSFYTENGNRRWRIAVMGYAEAGGYVDEGAFGSPNGYHYSAVAANTSITPTESSQSVGGSKYMMEGAVTVNAIPSNYVGSGITQRSSSDLTASGATVTAPAGYYGSAATKSVASGTEGTPTATKGTVSGNQITVTPSVTNSEGYIPGGTHTGTGVIVAASELVSGSNTLLTNGTFDVTNLASIITSFPSGFDCESGEFTPATDEVTHNISFTKTHYGLPFIAMVIDKDGYDSTADTNHSMVYFNWQDIFSNGIYSTSSSIMMGEIHARYRTTSLVTKNYTLWYSESNQSNASTYYPRYWVTETGMKAEVGSTSYWRASRTYKWFAAWKPTVMPSWARGSINTSTGETEENQNRISTSTFIHVRQIGNYFQVYVPNGARIYVTGYTSNYTFVPMTSAWQTGTVYINTTLSGYSTVEYIKITASYTDDSDISDVQTLAKNIIIRGVE